MPQHLVCQTRAAKSDHNRVANVSQPAPAILTASEIKHGRIDNDYIGVKSPKPGLNRPGYIPETLLYLELAGFIKDVLQPFRDYG